MTDPKTYESTTLIAANIKKKCGKLENIQEVEQQPVKIPNLNQ
jgi:hypothetical protein